MAKRRTKRTSRKRHNRTTLKRRYSRRHSRHRRYSRKMSYRGGEGNRWSAPIPPPLPPMGTHYDRSSRYLKPVLPPIAAATNMPLYADKFPDWRERRNTFVEMQDRKSRNMSGQFHYPSRESTYTPWEKVKYAFKKDTRPWPPVFL